MHHRRFTFNCFLTLNFVSASENQSFRIHRCEVLCSFESQSPVRPSDYNDLAGKIGGDEWYGSGKLLFQEREDGELSHGEGGRVDKQLHPLSG